MMSEDVDCFADAFTSSSELENTWSQWLQSLGVQVTTLLLNLDKEWLDWRSNSVRLCVCHSGAGSCFVVHKHTYLRDKIPCITVEDQNSDLMIVRFLLGEEKYRH